MTLHAQVLIDGISYVVDVAVSKEMLLRQAKLAAANATGRALSGGIYARVRKGGR